MIVDAEGVILGRLCTFVAKKALLGEEVIVVNVEKAIISGDRDMVLKREFEKLNIRNLGNPRKGPFHQRRADKYVRRSIRGMLPWHKYRGREAYKNIMVYVGMPEEEIKRKHNIDLKDSTIERINVRKPVSFVTVGEVCKSIGGKC